MAEAGESADARPLAEPDRCPDATEPRVASRLAPLNFSGLRLRLSTDRILPAETAVLRGSVRIRSCALAPASDGSVA